MARVLDTRVLALMQNGGVPEVRPVVICLKAYTLSIQATTPSKRLQVAPQYLPGIRGLPFPRYGLCCHLEFFRLCRASRRRWGWMLHNSFGYNLSWLVSALPQSLDVTPCGIYMGRKQVAISYLWHECAVVPITFSHMLHIATAPSNTSNTFEHDLVRVNMCIHIYIYMHMNTRHGCKYKYSSKYEQ